MKLFRHVPGLLRVGIVNRGKTGGRQFGVKTGMIFPDMTDTNHSDSQLLHRPFARDIFADMRNGASEPQA